MSWVMCSKSSLINFINNGIEMIVIVENFFLLELFRAADAILLAYDVIIAERAGTQVGQYGRVTI